MITAGNLLTPPRQFTTLQKFSKECAPVTGVQKFFRSSQLNYIKNNAFITIPGTKNHGQDVI